MQRLEHHFLPLVFALVPMSLFLMLRLGIVEDPQWVSGGFHFYIVSFTAFVAAVVAIVIVLAASQVQDARVFFLGMAFLSISGIFFVHALTTPGFIVQAMNPWVNFSAGLSLLVGASFLVLSTIPAHPWVHRVVMPNQGRILKGFLVGVAVYGVFAVTTSFVGPQLILSRMFTLLSSELLTRSTAAVAAGMLVYVIGHYLWLQRVQRSPLVTGLLLSTILLAQAIISMEFGPSFHASWWLYHLLMLSAFVCSIVSIGMEYRQRGSLVGLVDGLLLGGSIAQMQRGYNDAIVALVGAVEACDPYTRGHSERVARISLQIGEGLNLPAKDLRTLHQSALLHDIGKIGIPGTVLNKPGSLTEEEFRLVKEHPARGHQIIESVRSLQAEVSGIRHHHERLDGSGYPDGLASAEIPLIARIIAVADVFDALTSERPYRSAYPVRRALEIIDSETPHRLDQTIVQTLHATVRAESITAAATVKRVNSGARESLPAQPAAD